MSELTLAGGRARLFLQVSAIALAAVGISERKAEAAPGIADGGITIDVQGQYVFNNSGPMDGTFGGASSLPDSFGKTGELKPGDGYAFNGTISYQTPGSPWSFGVGVRYGRMKGRTGDAHLQSSSSGYYQYYERHPFSKYHRSFDQTVHERLTDTSHYVIDFMVGKDVGVGLFGRGVSTVGAGIRYAHFDSTVTGSFSTQTKYFYDGGPGGTSFSRTGKISISRHTDAVGPRIFAKTDSPFPGDSGFSLGAGVGLGVLFGRQTVHSDVHLSSGTYAGDLRVSKSQSQTIPTVDGYLQINWTAPRSPLSIGVGYRVDAYFTAINGGFSGSHEIDSIEHGPYLDVTFRIP